MSRVFQLEPQLFDVLDEIRSDTSVQILVLDTISALFKDALMGATSQGEIRRSSTDIKATQLWSLPWKKSLSSRTLEA